MISVGLVGTSWWSDIMFLPALAEHPQGRITAICGRNRDRAQEMADKWKIDSVYTDYNELIESGTIQALIVSTPNNSHYPITMKALEAGLHVLCEKPLAMNYGEAKRMAELAAQKNLKTFVPFTWRFMPNTRYVKSLVEDGYLGALYHCDVRSYANFGRDGNYMWRNDVSKAGSGVIGDLGSHYVYIVQWLFGPITRISAHVRAIVSRPTVDPDGNPYQAADDTATLQFEFESGATGTIHVSSVSADGIQLMDFQGSAGALYSRFHLGGNEETVSGMKIGDNAAQPLPIPDAIWAGANRDKVSDTFADVYYKQDWMARAFVTAIAEDKPIEPNFQDGASVQRVIDAALKSHQEQRWIDVDSIH